jgi:hypothetical protein
MSYLDFVCGLPSEYHDRTSPSLLFMYLVFTVKTNYCVYTIPGLSHAHLSLTSPSIPYHTCRLHTKSEFWTSGILHYVGKILLYITFGVIHTYRIPTPRYNAHPRCTKINFEGKATCRLHRTTPKKPVLGRVGPRPRQSNMRFSSPLKVLATKMACRPSF